jgi:DNA-binding IclR family transcriptional regulator
MLMTLSSEGMILRDASRQYALGYKTVYLGYQAQRGLPLNAVAEPIIEGLVESTGETVHLVTLNGLERVIIAMTESPQPVRVSTPVGTKFPLYYGGTGLCLFAWLDTKTQDQILRGNLSAKTASTELRPDEIRRTAALIKERGYHVAVGDFADSAFSIAAPIFSADGQVTASICVTGPVSRLTSESEARTIQLVTEAGKAISAGLGYRK